MEFVGFILGDYKFDVWLLGLIFWFYKRKWGSVRGVYKLVLNFF